MRIDVQVGNNHSTCSRYEHEQWHAKMAVNGSYTRGGSSTSPSPRTLASCYPSVLLVLKGSESTSTRLRELGWISPRIYARFRSVGWDLWDCGGLGSGFPLRCGPSSRGLRLLRTYFCAPTADILMEMMVDHAWFFCEAVERSARTDICLHTSLHFLLVKAFAVWCNLKGSMRACTENVAGVLCYSSNTVHGVILFA